MQQNFRLIYPTDYDVSSEIPMKDFQFIRTLQIDDMVVLKKESYRGFADLTQVYNPLLALSGIFSEKK